MISLPGKFENGKNSENDLYSKASSLPVFTSPLTGFPVLVDWQWRG